MLPTGKNEIHSYLLVLLRKNLPHKVIHHIAVNFLFWPLQLSECKCTTVLHKPCMGEEEMMYHADDMLLFQHYSFIVDLRTYSCMHIIIIS